jgi:hypothetical protein
MTDKVVGVVLYIDRVRGKYYNVPAHHTLPPGDSVIRNMFGQERSVNPVALAPFEISAYRARRYLLRQALSLLREANKAPDLQLRDLLRLPGLTARRGLRLLSGLRALLTGVTSDDPGAQEAAREQMRALREWLAAQGVESNEVLESLPDQLREQYQEAGELERLTKSAQALDEVSEQLDTSLTAVAADRSKGPAKIRKHAKLVRQEDRQGGAEDKSSV